MATGDDLTEFDPYRGNWPKNDDMLEQGVWIQHPKTKVVHLVYHKYQVHVLLQAGGLVVPDPRARGEAEAPGGVREEPILAPALKTEAE